MNHLGKNWKKPLKFDECCNRTDQGEMDDLNNASYRLNVLHNILLVSVVDRESSEASVLGRSSVIRSHAALVTL